MTMREKRKKRGKRKRTKKKKRRDRKGKSSFDDPALGVWGRWIDSTPNRVKVWNFFSSPVGLPTCSSLAFVVSPFLSLTLDCPFLRGPLVPVRYFFGFLSMVHANTASLGRPGFFRRIYGDGLRRRHHSPLHPNMKRMMLRCDLFILPTSATEI